MNIIYVMRFRAWWRVCVRWVFNPQIERTIGTYLVYTSCIYYLFLYLSPPIVWRNWIISCTSNRRMWGYAGCDTGILRYRFAYDARSRCHSLVMLRWDGDNSFILFFARWTTGPRARAPETPVFPSKIRLQVIPIQFQYLCPGNYRPFKVIQGNTVTTVRTINNIPFYTKF